MTTSHSCTIRLLNRSYDIKCPEHALENIHAAAVRLNAALMENRKKCAHLDELQVMLLAALQVSHDLVVSEQERESQRQQMARFIHSLEGKINQAVRGFPESDMATD